MKTLKRISLVVGILASVGLLHAQDWKIFNPDYVYNFQYTTSEYYLSNTVWIDSFEVQGSDTVFYFSRRAVRDSIYLLANQPHFLQRKATISGNLIHFSDTASYVMKQKIEVGDSWLFDTLNNIFAICTEKYSTTNFGNSDSVKCIVLSNSDTMLLSKNYGFLQFPDFASDDRYILKGIDNLQIGECSPKFADFFTFNVGDEFVYEKWYLDPGQNNERYDRYTILSILSQTDSISYLVKNKYWHHIDTHPWPYLNETGTDTIILTFKPNEYLLSEFYNDQLITNYDSTVQDYIFWGGNDSYYTVSNVFFDELGLLTKRVGYEVNSWPGSCLFIDSPLQDTLEMYYGDMMCYQKIKKGIGLYIDVKWFFEQTMSTRLIAWQTQNSSFGNIDTVAIYWYYNQQEYEATQVSIYPNPNNGLIYISGLQGLEYQLTLFDISGKRVLQKQIEGPEVSLHLDGITDGVYFIDLRGRNMVVLKKLIVVRE